ncbi:MAG: Hsp20/alpha crystallin family protein [Betaproteobacteria bacterium]
MPSRNDPTGWMWSQACDLIDQAERLQRQFFHLSQRTLATWEPPVDVFEDEREIVIVVAMPGVAAEGVQVVSEPGALVVRGARAFPFSGSRHRVRQLEIPYGMFERRIVLPAGRFEVGAPELTQGCLLLRLRKIGQVR